MQIMQTDARRISLKKFICNTYFIENLIMLTMVQSSFLTIKLTSIEVQYSTHEVMSKTLFQLSNTLFFYITLCSINVFNYRFFIKSFQSRLVDKTHPDEIIYKNYYSYGMCLNHVIEIEEVEFPRKKSLKVRLIVKIKTCF